MHQADLLEYYLKTIPGVKNAAVDERTGHATIEFTRPRANAAAAQIVTSRPTAPASTSSVAVGTTATRASSRAVASCRADGPVIITGAEAVKKSSPDFFTDFTKLGGKIEILED